MKAEQVINELKLTPLSIEGGYFHEIYRGTHGTSIYYLLRHGERSKWHRVKSDEIWYYHAGVPALQLIIHPDGRLEKTVIGPNVAKGERPQSLIPGGAWQTAIPLSSSRREWGLFGAAVFPAFEYEDFTGAEDAEIEAKFPQLAKAIRESLSLSTTRRTALLIMLVLSPFVLFSLLFPTWFGFVLYSNAHPNYGENQPVHEIGRPIIVYRWNYPMDVERAEKHRKDFTATIRNGLYSSILRPDGGGYLLVFDRDHQRGYFKSNPR